MNTKFVAKNNNLVIVLEHGIPPEPITGRQGVPTLFVKFVDGIAIPTAMSKYTAEEIAEKMREHPGFGKDFVEVTNETDPYKNVRKDTEPRHSITEMNFGHLGKKYSSPKSIQSIPPEHRELITTVASKMAKDMVKDILKEIGINKNTEIENTDENTEVENTTKIENTRGASNPEESEPDPNFNNEEKERFICEICGKELKSKAGLLAHKRNCRKLQKEKEEKN